MEHFRGQKIANVAKVPGLYAWYYKPRLEDWDLIANQLNNIFSNSSKIETRATLRYGMSLIAKSDAKMCYSADKLTIDVLLDSLKLVDKKSIINFMKNDDMNIFMRPLYIGIASNLNRRVYKDHYSQLVSYYESDSPVNRFIKINPEASVDDVMSSLGIPHSFAIEARTRNIAPSDLIVYTYEMPDMPITDDSEDLEESESPSKRTLERVLQLLTDPVCGRR